MIISSLPFTGKTDISTNPTCATSNVKADAPSGKSRKVYPCKSCPKSFLAKHSLKRHVKEVCCSQKKGNLTFSLPSERLYQNDPRIFVVGNATYTSPCRSARRSVGPSHSAFFAFLGILKVGKFVFEHSPAPINTAPAQIITTPAQLITAPAQPPATGAAVYTALFENP